MNPPLHPSEEGSLQLARQTALLSRKDLGGQLDGAPGAPVLRALAIAHLVRGDLKVSDDLGKQLLARAANTRNRSLRADRKAVLKALSEELEEECDNRLFDERSKEADGQTLAERDIYR